MRNFKFDGNAMRPNVYVASASQTTQPPLLIHQLLLAIFVSVFICFSGAAQAQSRQDVGTAEAVKPLQIGDTIPEELWNMPLQVVNHPEGKDTITLNDYRDKKLIILDFWATWCGNCIRVFPKLQSFQEQFKNDVEFILATVQDGMHAEKFLMERDFNLYSIVQTREGLSKIFPHLFIPYYIWIGNGRVIATTEPDEVTDENIRKYIVQGTSPSRIRRDRMDFSLDNHFVNDSSIMQASVLKTAFVSAGIIQNVPKQVKFGLSNNNHPSYYAAANSDIPGLYESVIAIDRPDLRNPHRFIYETKWESKLKNSFFEYHNLDSTNHIYSIQYFGFDKDKPSLRKKVMSQINSFLKEQYGIIGEIQNRPLKAHLIKKAGKSDPNQLFKNMEKIKVYRLVNILDLRNHRRGLSVPWIDATENGMETVFVPKELPEDLSAINKILSTQGFEAIEEEVLMDVFVIRDAENIK